MDPEAPRTSFWSRMGKIAEWAPYRRPAVMRPALGYELMGLRYGPGSENYRKIMKTFNRTLLSVA